MKAMARHAAGLGLAHLVLLIGCFSGNPVEPPTGPQWFSTDVAGLDYALPPATRDVEDGDTLMFEAAPVKKSFGGRDVRMLAFNGSIPGPIIRVRQGAEIIVIFKNRTGFPNGLLSHGVRSDNLIAGNQGVSGHSVPHDGGFTYRIRFPDAGISWYHARQRSDYFLEMGLYGNFLVIPSDSAYWKPVNREEVLALDDFHLDSGTWTAPFRIDEVDRTMMGRFGGIFLTNGDTAYGLEVKRKEVVRFFVTNVCNTRVLNLGITPDSGLGKFDIKVVGADNGKYEVAIHSAHELLAPGERTVFEAYFDRPGNYSLVHSSMAVGAIVSATTVLGRIKVLSDSVDTPYGDFFSVADSSRHAIAGIDSVRLYTEPDIAPDQELLMTGYMGRIGDSGAASAGKNAAAMHDPGTVGSKGIEWTDHMAEMNAFSNTTNMKWILRDARTGAENNAIDWRFRRGDKVKIRIKNEIKSSHPMPHPIHFQGQRFLVMYVNNRRNHNMAWKDTHLVGMAETVDILLDAGNPGLWMAKCGIAEHAEAKMMFPFRVE